MYENNLNKDLNIVLKSKILIKIFVFVFLINLNEYKFCSVLNVIDINLIL